MSSPGRRILRIDQDTITVAAEAPLDTEDTLHRAVADHPEVLPADDLGLGRLVTAASHLPLPEGEVDLLCVDRSGQLAVVEFKKGSENPDARRVVAQLLDYGAALWRMDYTELEEQCRRARGGFSGGLVDHVAAQLDRLGEPELDPEAFQQGVEATLDSGTFGFIYVARDLDPRTRRIATYLAEGPRLAFFPVEIDHYLDPHEGSRVLVPRTAFTPSWLAPGGAGRTSAGRVGRQTAPRRERLATASPAFHELVGKMDALAQELGLDSRDAQTGRTYRPAGAPQQALGVYATNRGVEFNLADLRSRGQVQVADKYLAQLETLAGRSLGSDWPYIPCESLTNDWRQLRRELVEPFLRVHEPTSMAEPGPQGIS